MNILREEKHRLNHHWLVCERSELFYRIIKNMQAVSMVFCNWLALQLVLGQFYTVIEPNCSAQLFLSSIFYKINSMYLFQIYQARSESIMSDRGWKRKNLCGLLRISSWCCHDAAWREAPDTGSYFVCHQCFMGSGIIVVSNITTPHHKAKTKRLLDYTASQDLLKKQTSKKYRTRSTINTLILLSYMQHMRV